ncbi:MAG: ribosome-associated translation inhibitor RaiA [Anaerolineaceae bacterium]|nr:ribosome-associated translation inhibitor RaiA [Anaerolineaceae bacterium]
MAAKAELYAKNMEITETVRDHILKKISRLDRYLNTVEETRVDLAFVKSARSASDRHVAQITLRGKGYILRTEERADDLFAAIDAALDKMQRQIERYKGKRYHGPGSRTPTSAVAADVETGEDIEELPVIARRKVFNLVPMNELEAVEQMKLLGHENFFVFYNADSDAINVLYQRRDGTYGLIEPKLG